MKLLGNRIQRSSHYLGVKHTGIPVTLGTKLNHPMTGTMPTSSMITSSSEMGKHVQNLITPNSMSSTKLQYLPTGLKKKDSQKIGGESLEKRK